MKILIPILFPALLLTIMSACGVAVGNNTIAYHCTFHPGMIGTIEVIDTTGTPPSQITNSVTISDAGFSPAAVTVPNGSIVIWNNTGSLVHTVTADNGSFDSGSISSGVSYTNTISL